MKIAIYALSLLLLFIARPSWAKTPWEVYLGYPTPQNASRVTKIEYSPKAIPENYGYWAPDLEILKNQILGGDSESFRLAFRLLRTSDGGLLEDLTAILSHTIRPRPELFLREVLELGGGFGRAGRHSHDARTRVCRPSERRIGVKRELGSGLAGLLPK